MAAECDGHTDRQTDAKTMAKTREALHAVARKKIKKRKKRQVSMHKIVVSFLKHFIVFLSLITCSDCEY